MRLPDVLERTGFSKSTLYRLRRQGAFPPGFLIGGTIRAWKASEIQAWIDDLSPSPTPIDGGAS